MAQENKLVQATRALSIAKEKAKVLKGACYKKKQKTLGARLGAFPLGL